MTPLEQLENKIRQSIPELKEEWEILQESAIDADMITQIGLNHVLEYLQNYGIVWYMSIYGGFSEIDTDSIGISWNLKSAYLKHQSEELINFLNELK